MLNVCINAAIAFHETAKERAANLKTGRHQDPRQTAGRPYAPL
jgi:hypothetical protein